MSFMRNLVCLASASAAALAGTVWDGGLDKLQFISKLENQKFEPVENGFVFMADTKAINADGGYVVFKLDTKPFRLDKASLLMDVHNLSPLEGHCFYVKCYNSSNQIVASFYTYGKMDSPTSLVLTPGRNTDDIGWFYGDIKGKLADEIVTLRFFCHYSEVGTMKMSVANIDVGGPAPRIKPVDIKDYGFTVRGGTERGVFATSDADGKDALVVWLMDGLNRRLLQIDAENGGCVEVPHPPTSTPDAVYSSIISSKELIYSLVGRDFLEYDARKKAFTAHHNCPHPVAMSMCEGQDGLIWAASYPDSGLVSFNPVTREFKDYGCVNKENWAQYPRTVVAHTDGWIYMGIGSTAGQIVAYNPAEGKSVPLLSSEYRSGPSSYSVSTYSDGNVYGVGDSAAAGNWFRLEDGKAVKLDGKPEASIVAQRTGTQYYVLKDFPSGRKLKTLKPVDMYIITTAADGSDEKRVDFKYNASHTGLMGLAITSDGIVGGGGFFPFRFGTLDIKTGKTTEEQCDEQCNSITSFGKYLYIGGYCGGQLMRMDPTRPWTLKNPMEISEPDFDSNPVFYGKADPVINRPHAAAVTPEGDRFIVGGTPTYGATGGGLAITDLATGKFTIIDHEELAEYESPYSLAPMGRGLLMIGTTVGAGTGGEVKARGASLLLYDMDAGKLLWKAKYPSEIGGIGGLLALDNGMVLGIAGFEAFLFDPVRRGIVRTGSVSGFGDYTGSQALRLLFKGPDGEVYLLFGGGLALLDTETCTVKDFMGVPGGIAVGAGIYEGRFYYASPDSRWKSVGLDYFKE